jgi:hypothetical protein
MLNQHLKAIIRTTGYDETVCEHHDMLRQWYDKGISDYRNHPDPLCHRGDERDTIDAFPPYHSLNNRLSVVPQQDYRLQLQLRLLCYEYYMVSWYDKSIDEERSQQQQQIGSATGKEKYLLFVCTILKQYYCKIYGSYGATVPTGMRDI